MWTRHQTKFNSNDHYPKKPEIGENEQRPLLGRGTLAVSQSKKPPIDTEDSIIIGKEKVGRGGGYDSKEEEEERLIVNSGTGGTSLNLNDYVYDMSLPIRMDVAAALAYPFGLLGALFLLSREYQNDLVRFHAWQSFILSSFTLMILLILRVVLPKAVGWVAALAWIGGCYLAWLTFEKSPSLQLVSIPIIGPIATQWVQRE